jgi:hypothetical protein
MKKFNILKILFIILLISSSVKAEIVINSIGESIKLNSDGTWEKQTDNNILLHKGSKEIFFEFKFWINKAYLYKFSSVDSFNNEKKFKKLKTRCGGGGVMYNKRKSDVIISNFTMPLEFIGNKYEFTLITLPVLRTIIKENSMTELQPAIVSNDQIESINENDMSILTNQIQDICNWKNFTNMLEPSASVRYLDIEFSDNLELKKNIFWDHTTIELIKKDTIFELIESTD